MACVFVGGLTSSVAGPNIKCVALTAQIARLQFCPAQLQPRELQTVQVYDGLKRLAQQVLLSRTREVYLLGGYCELRKYKGRGGEPGDVQGDSDERERAGDARRGAGAARCARRPRQGTPQDTEVIGMRCFRLVLLCQSMCIIRIFLWRRKQQNLPVFC